MAIAQDFYNVIVNAEGDVSVRYQTRDNSPEHLKELECYADLIKTLLSFPCYEVEVTHNLVPTATQEANPPKKLDAKPNGKKAE